MIRLGPEVSTAVVLGRTGGQRDVGVRLSRSRRRDDVPADSSGSPPGCDGSAA
jgi:hypothetical protein